jgi:hypothetical protein
MSAEKWVPGTTADFRECDPGTFPERMSAEKWVPGTFAVLTPFGALKI